VPVTVVEGMEEEEVKEVNLDRRSPRMEYGVADANTTLLPKKGRSD